MRINVTMKGVCLGAALSLLTADCGRAVREATTEATPLEIRTATAQTVELPSLFEAGGVVRARTTATIASRLLAPIVAVHVRAGDRVRRGDRLVTLDGREIQANQAQAAAALAGRTDAVDAATGAMHSSEATLALARATHDRVRTLHEKRSATAQELDQAVAALDAAQSQLQSAKANLAAAAADQQAAQAAREATSIMVSYTTLTAPFDGIVVDRQVDPGTMATPGSPLVTLEDPAVFRLEVTVDEARAAAIVPSQAADVWIGGQPGASGWTKARVSEIARIDPAGHTFLVKLELPSGAGLRSGTFGRARFAGPTRRAVVVPATSAVRRGQLTFVFVVGTDQRARLQPISPGALVDGRLEVLAGLAAGDRVTLEAPASLSDGARITESSR